MRNIKDWLSVRLGLSRRELLAMALAAGVCLAAIVGAALLVPRVVGETGAMPAQYGSSIFFQEIGSYFVIGLLSFVLGIAVTLLAIHQKKRWRGGGKP